MLEKQVDGFLAGRRRRHHPHVGLAIDERRDAFPDDSVIVNAQDSNQPVLLAKCTQNSCDDIQRS
jgi:hypothetical protein